MEFHLSVPRNFNFWSTVYSHGWCALPPFRVSKELKCLCAIVPDGGGKHDLLSLWDGKGKILVSVEHRHELTPAEIARLSKSVSTMFRLEESFDEFYREARKHPRYRWVKKRGAGRLLRCPTVFEDVVKMICTTNCSWALTETIVGALTTKLGTRVGDGLYSFPTADAIAGQSESFLRKEIRCGYRAPYLLELSRRVVGRELAIEEWRMSNAPTDQLFRDLRSVKGVGEYAAGNLLKLLGRYDYMGLDSWCRGRFYQLFKHGRKVKDSTIERHYAPFGKWRGLFMWMDVTKDWYEKTFPF